MVSRIRQDVISEVIDGEVIAIDLATGVYYNLRHSAVLCWTLLSSGHSDSAVIEGLMEHFDVDRPDAERAVEVIVGQLEEFGLLLASGESVSEEASPPAAAGQRSSFDPPTIERFEEMAYVLGIDPVHEVDVKAGWPNPA